VTPSSSASLARKGKEGIRFSCSESGILITTNMDLCRFIVGESNGKGKKAGSPGRTRTYNLAVNSQYKKVRRFIRLKSRRGTLFEKRNL